MNYDRLRDLIKNQTTDISFEDYKLRYAGERFLIRLEQTLFKNSFKIPPFDLFRYLNFHC